MTGYLARDFLVPRTFIFSCNAESLVIQSTLPETKVAFLNSTAATSLSPIYYLNADHDIFRITKDNSERSDTVQILREYSRYAGSHSGNLLCARAPQLFPATRMEWWLPRGIMVSRTSSQMNT